MGSAAVWWAKRGIPVFPCWTESKEPATSNGFYDATLDARLIKAWWPPGSTNNVAGRVPPGLVVLDVDRRGGGGGTVREAMSATGVRFPETMTTVTRDGFHLWYKTSAGGWPKTVGGIDIRVGGGHGYIMLPPSAHPDGGCYSLKNKVTKVVELPQELASWLTQYKKPYTAGAPSVVHAGWDVNECLRSWAANTEHGRHDRLLPILARLNETGWLDIYLPVIELLVKNVFATDESGWLARAVDWAKTSTTSPPTTPPF